MPTINEHVLAKPFDKAVEYFRQKLNIPTSRWDDLWKEQHAKGFMVAGAMKAEMLTDFREAIDAAIAKGESLQDFRNRFDDIVDKYGWNYTGSRNWRTKVIYNTNLRTAYMSGRYKQMKDPDVTALRPYWQYRHGNSRNPRLQHLAWHGMVLRHDDPWWDTHYPPSGFGCKCRVITMSQRDLDKRGLKPESPPDLGTYDWKDKDGNTHTIPKGIDPGWDYNVGKASGQSFKVLTNKFETIDYGIADKWISSYVEEPAFKMFIDGKIKGEFPVAVLSIDFRKMIGADVQAVFLSTQTLKKNQNHHPELTLTDYQSIPDVIRNAQLVIQDGKQTMVFIRKNNKWFHAAIKSTATGKGLFLTSFRYTENRDVERMKKKGNILRDES